LSGIIDMTVVLLLAIGLFMLLANGAVDIGFHNLSYKISQFSLQEKSGLFDITKDSAGNYLGVAPLTYDLTKEDDYKRFTEKINYYYFNFVEKENKSNAEFNKKYMLFDEITCKNAIFSITGIDDEITTYTLLDEVTDVSTNKKYTSSDGENYKNAIANFFIDSNKGVYNLALTDFTSCERFVSIQNRLQWIERLEVFICVAISTFAFISLPVLLNKNGETAMMHIFGICFVDSYGYKLKWRHRIIRSIVVLVLNSVSVFLFAFPLAVNAIVYLVTPSKRSIVDFASNETAIDRKTSVILEA
ncbi:MAG: RDD family protein, partial [Bacilli bacterium]|nr:RDD family protein [Bacilli bacterium]